MQAPDLPGALCADPSILPADAWFSEDGGDLSAAAQLVCGYCPARADCLAWAIGHGEEHGVWGGLRPAERPSVPGPAVPAPAGGPG